MISVILPTYNEAANIGAIIDFLDGVLQDEEHEIIVVDDDSPDATWQVAEGLRTKYQSLRVLRRQNTRGLSSAVVDGFDMARGDVLVVMDADGQHDPDLLPQVIGAITSGADVAIGSRYIEGGSVGDWITDRRIISGIGTFFARSLSRVTVTDPLAGFFAIKRTLYRSVRSSLRPTGFKILLEILAHVPGTTKLTEVPLQFRMRQHGHSKLSMQVHLDFILQVLRLIFLQLPRLLWIYARQAFVLLSIIIALASIARAHGLLSLRDASVRSAVSSALKSVADHNGWLVSDFSIVSVTAEHATVWYQEHTRSGSPSIPCILTFDPPSLSCDDAQ